ncbi:MAG: PHP-associated domain-containing protein, partial [bacterium]
MASILDAWSHWALRCCASLGSPPGAGSDSHRAGCIGSRGRGMSGGFASRWNLVQTQ